MSAQTETPRSSPSLAWTAGQVVALATLIAVVTLVVQGYGPVMLELVASGLQDLVHAALRQGTVWQNALSTTGY